ncbi:hypothetical protein ACHAXT_001204 [Thalassiosira profunda]
MHPTPLVLVRRSAPRCRGRFSSMLDMGGVGEAKVDTRINVGKNNKVRAVALDFHLITRSIEERRRRALEEKENVDKGGGTSHTAAAATSAAASVQPDASLVEKMASLLNVKLGSDSSSANIPAREDDMSAILGSSSASNAESTEDAKKPTPKAASAPPHMDIRSKYAAKLRKKIDGGVAGIDVAKSDREDMTKHGDAAIHLAARELMSSDGMVESTSSSRWLATTGVGKLLSFLSGRSMQIALLPLPSTSSHPQSDDDVKQTKEEMESLTKQLPNVRFDLLVPDGRRSVAGALETSNDDTAEYVVKNVLSKIDVPPIKFVAVSDRDDYLKAARDNGMFTCRIRPKNVFGRGSLTTNYTVEDVAGVQDVINDINGISFNSALKG